MARTHRGGVVYRRLFAVSMLAVTLMLGGLGTEMASAADYMIYGEGLAGGWQDWSWGSNVNFWGTNAAWGSRGISWQTWQPWAGFYLHTDSPVGTGSDTALVFALMASQTNQRLTVSVYSDNGQRAGGPRDLAEFGGPTVAWQWKWYTIPLSQLGAAGRGITGFVIQDGNGWAQPAVQIDEIKLTNVTSALGLAPASVSGSGSGSGSGCLGVPSYREIRPENAAANATRGRATIAGNFYGHPGWRWYYDRIDGACTGTTEQILEWAAKKWGFDQLGYPDLAKSMATLETWWRNAFVGQSGEVGILQIHPSFWPDYQPATWSTAFAADYAMAVVRSYYDGASWLGDATRGDLRGSVAAWNCGCAYNGGNWYANAAMNYNNTKPWKRPGQPPEWF
jgi:hypothetical protein